MILFIISCDKHSDLWGTVLKFTIYDVAKDHINGIIDLCQNCK